MSWFDSCDLEYALADLKADNERLQDENERLRSCLSDSAENSKQIMHEAHVQEEENAKLRELCRRLARALGIWSDWCNRDCGAEFGCDWTAEGCTAAEMLRELGVEV